ncbi:MAG: sulfatase-like hydrolase/transferase [Planctomycetota bacterium]
MRNLALVFVVLLAGAATAERPNIVLIMADDLGYRDIGCYGHPEIRTPVLDQLASEGIRLTSYYAGATVCTPSRVALLTGCYPVRFGWEKGVVGYMIGTDRGLAPQAVTMAEVFQAAGYRTGLFGKWHLGDAPEFRPNRQGFDHSLYIDKSNNQTNELWRDDRLERKPFDNRLLSQRFTEAAVKFLQSGKKQPFLLYVPFSAPHFPVQPHPKWVGRSNFGEFGDVVEEMDSRVGEILKALQENGLSENTIVIFTSDNGPEPMTKSSSALPCRGKKWSALEGGTRVPCIVRWPEKIQPGTTCSQLIAAIDWLPTLAAACQVEPTVLPKTIDGQNVLPTLVGDTSQSHARRELLYWHGSEGLQAIRRGRWKLFLSGKNATLDNKLTGQSPVLFDVEGDIGETKDRSAEFPQVVTELKARAAELATELNDSVVELGRADSK